MVGVVFIALNWSQFILYHQKNNFWNFQNFVQVICNLWGFVEDHKIRIMIPCSSQKLFYCTHFFDDLSQFGSWKFPMGPILEVSETITSVAFRQCVCHLRMKFRSKFKSEKEMNFVGTQILGKNFSFLRFLFKVYLTPNLSLLSWNLEIPNSVDRAEIITKTKATTSNVVCLDGKKFDEKFLFKISSTFESTMKNILANFLCCQHQSMDICGAISPGKLWNISSKSS